MIAESLHASCRGVCSSLATALGGTCSLQGASKIGVQAWPCKVQLGNRLLFSGPSSTLVHNVCLIMYWILDCNMVHNSKAQGST